MSKKKSGRKLNPSSQKPRHRPESHIENKIVATVMGEKFSGPIPPPQTLQEYENILPGAADRIMKSFETQVAHRIRYETIALNGDFAESRRGQFLGAFINVVLIIGASFCAYIDKQWIGAAMLGAPAYTGIKFLFEKAKKGSKQSSTEEKGEQS